MSDVTRVFGLDLLIIDGRAVQLYCCPPLPLGDPRLVCPREPGTVASLGWIHRNLGWDGDPLPKSARFERGYVATWRIERAELFLASVSGEYGLENREPISATWVSGTLRTWQPFPGLEDYGPYWSLRGHLLIQVEAGRVRNRCEVRQLGRMEIWLR